MLINKHTSYKINQIIPRKKEIIIDKYNSIKDAAKWVFDNNLANVLEFNRLSSSIISSKICAVANNKRNRAYGFFWKYNNEPKKTKYNRKAFQF